MYSNFRYLGFFCARKFLFTTNGQYALSKQCLRLQKSVCFADVCARHFLHSYILNTRAERANSYPAVYFNRGCDCISGSSASICDVDENNSISSPLYVLLYYTWDCLRLNKIGQRNRYCRRQRHSNTTVAVTAMLILGQFRIVSK